MADTTTNADYVAKYNMVEDFFGFKIRNGDRDDHFFRECEYKTAAVFSGFDLVHFDQTLPAGIMPAPRLGPRDIARRILRFVRGLVNPASRRPSAERVVNRSVFVFRKRSTPYIPHAWA